MSTFREQLKQFFAKTFKGFYIEVTKPKKFLLDCGVPNLPIVVRPATLNLKIEKHQLTKEHLQNLNTCINAPLLVYKSEWATSAFNIVVEKKNHEGLLCVTMYTDAKIKKVVVNEIATISGRNLNQLIKWTEDGYLIDWDSKKLWEVLSDSCFNCSKCEYLLSLLNNTAKLKQKNQNTKGLGKNILGTYDRLPNPYIRLEDKIFPKDEKITKIYEKICKKRELSLHLLNELKTYINDTKRNISQVAGALRTDDRTFAASLVLRASTCGHSASSFGILSTGHEAYRRRMLQSRLLRQFAELEDIWYQSKDEFIARNELIVAKDKYGMDIEGMETKLYLCPNDYSAYKFLRLNADCNSLYDNLAERIVLHNLMFGDKTALCIEGLFFENSFITFAASQPYIEGAMRLTKKEQRTKFFSQFDNFNHKKNCIKNSDLVIGDLHNNNILVDKNGDFYVIDCYAKFYREEDLLNYYNDRESSTPSKISLRNLSGISNSDMQSRELDIVIKARAIAQNGESLRSRFNAMLELYENQPTIRPTDTKSKLFQQYSTPCPLAFLASEFVKQEGKRYYFEPSAGNGMLTISLPEQFTCVNELDEVRYKNLRKQGFCRVTQLDSSKKIDLYGGSFFDGVITNPPFKSLPKSEQEVRNGFNLATLDYKMAAVALDQMKGVGKAAVIVGGKLFDNYWKPVKGTDKKMLFGQWKVFLGWLYGQYNVVDVIYIGGDYIYRKQGTTYPVVLILINGRHIFDKNKHKPRYIFDPVKDKIIETYEQLFERVSPHLEKQQQEAYYSPLFDNLIKLLKLKNCKTLSGTDENLVKNFQEKICKDGFNSVTLNQLNNIINDIQNGTIQIQTENARRVARNYNRPRSSRNAYAAAVICGREGRAYPKISFRDKEGFVKETERSAQYEKLLEQWAKSEGCWVENLADFVQDYEKIGEGSEAKVYDVKTEKSHSVLKIIGLNMSGTVQRLVERIYLHNCLFGDSTYLDIIGFGRDESGYFKFILEQPYIVGRKVRIARINKFLLKKFPNLNQISLVEFYNSDFIIRDLHNKNVLKDHYGNFYVIDCFLAFNYGDLKGLNGVQSLSGIIKPLYYDHDTEEDFNEYGKSRTATNGLLKDVKAFAKRLKNDLGLEDYYCRGKKRTISINHTECDVHFVVPQAQAPNNHLHIKFEVDHPLRGINYDYSLREWFPMSLGPEHSFGDTIRLHIFDDYEDILRDIKIRYPIFRKPQNKQTEKFSPLFDNEIKLANLCRKLKHSRLFSAD